MKFRLCVRIGLGLAAAGYFALAASLRAAEPAFTFRMGTVLPRGSSFHKSFQNLGEQWRAAPGGGVRLDIYPNTQGGEPTIVRRMNDRVAQLDGAMLTAVGMGQIDRSVTVLEMMPMVFRSWEEVDFVRERLRPRLEKAFYDKGYVVLFWGDAGWIRWFSTQPILRPSDLKTMNVFAASGDPEAVELMKSYYHPVVLEPDRILSSLQTGMINTAPIPAFLANFLQVSTKTRHMLDLDFAPVVGAMVITRRAWDKLPSVTQASVRKLAEQAGEEIRRNSRKEEREAVAAMQQKDRLQVHTLPPGAEQEWRDELAKIYPKLRGTVVPADYFDEVMAALAEFRSRNPANK